MALVAQTVFAGSVQCLQVCVCVCLIVVEWFVFRKFCMNSRKVCFIQFCSKKCTVSQHDSVLRSAISKSQLIGVWGELH